MADTSAKPLSGVRVIDFTTYVAAPSCSLTLGYLGADVIKVEPVSGDPNRLSPLGLNVPATALDNPMYDAVNAYKRGIAVNLRTDEGKDVMRRLLSDADIFITNYRTKALQGIGITYDEVHEYNPAIVYGQLDGYGEKGPDAPRAGFDYIAFFARAGFADITQYEGVPPMVPTFGSGDTVSGMALAIGVLAAYLKAKETGTGERVTTSLLANGLWMLNCAIVQNQFSKVKSSLDNPNFMAISCYYQCADGVWVRFCGLSAERYWASFCRALGLEEYIDDPRFATSTAQRENNPECIALLRERVLTKSYDEWDPIFRANDLPYEKVQTATEAAYDPQAVANGYVFEADYPRLGKKINAVMPPIKMTSIHDTERGRGPVLGQHSHEILIEAGFSESEAAALLTSGAVIESKSC